MTEVPMGHVAVPAMLEDTAGYLLVVSSSARALAEVKPTMLQDGSRDQVAEVVRTDVQLKAQRP